jgi:hypothetical protein
MGSKLKTGDEAYYAVLERVEIVSTDESKTHVRIKVLTGLMKGQVLEVPVEKIERLK